MAADGRSSAPAGAVRRAIAVGGGLGYAPVASGTFGSLPGLALAWGLWRVAGWPAVAAGTVVVALVGLWASDGMARSLGRTDPGEVVVDEIAGQMAALLFLAPTWQVMAAGFFLFRLFDVTKPFPARRAEGLPGGLGIMVDDLVAGTYANVCLQALAWWAPGLLGIA